MSHMPGEDEEEEDPTAEEPWDPEDDKAEKDYMKIAKQFMKEQLESMREMRAATQKRQAQTGGQAPSQPLSHLYQGMMAVGLGAQTPNVQIRRIENGFLMTYNEVKEMTQGTLHAGHGGHAMPAGALPPSLMAAIASASHVHRVEAFVKNAEEALPHLKAAMESMERLAKMGGFTL